MSEITTLGDQSICRLANLAEELLCKTLLVLPHGNADPERLFSMVNKIETDQRSSLLPSTVSDLISVTIPLCYESGSPFTPPLLESAKEATLYNLGQNYL